MMMGQEERFVVVLTECRNSYDTDGLTEAVQQFQRFILLSYLVVHMCAALLGIASELGVIAWGISRVSLLHIA